MRGWEGGREGEGKKGKKKGWEDGRGGREGRKEHVPVFRFIDIHVRSLYSTVRSLYSNVRSLYSNV